MSEVLPNGTIILDTPQDIDFFRLLSLYHALELETEHGIRMSSRMSALQAAKRSGFAGSRPKILAQIRAQLEQMEATKKSMVQR